MSDTKPENFDDLQPLLKAKLGDTYRERPQQSEMAQRMREGLWSDTHSIIEAPTGVGKSFAALTEAVFWAKKAGSRVVVSTGTKALQRQLVEKDLPFLQGILPVDFTFAALQGASNYLCLERLMFADIDQSLKDKIEVRSQESDFDGTREGLGFILDPAVWYEICSDTDACKDCEPSRCFLKSARLQARLATICVANHTLLALDLSIREKTENSISILGDVGAVIIDEAHEFPDWARDAFATKLSPFQSNQILGCVRSIARAGGISLDEDLETTFLGTSTAFWYEVEDLVGREVGTHEISLEQLAVRLGSSLNDHYLAARALGDDIRERSSSAGLTSSQHSTLNSLIENYANSLWDVLFSEGDVVRIVNVSRGKNNVLRYRIEKLPITVAPILTKTLFSWFRTSMISATLSVSGSFGYFRSEIGCPEGQIEAIIDSPFDYQNRTVAFVPASIPEPSGRSRSEWSALAPEYMRDLIEMTGGGALVLFTSYSAMRQAHQSLKDRIGCASKCQGDDSPQKLAEWMKEDIQNRVLFATRSFFTGVDMPGLNLVIIDKLPFAVFTDPLYSARSDLLERNGGNPFRDLSLPMMTLTLQQAVGRLMRREESRGAFVILDSRLLSKGYGAGVLQSLPPSPLVTEMSEVREFFETNA